jgi:hypothetical protein
MIMLAATFGVNSLIGLSSVSFPASVACMVVLFFALIACDFAIGAQRTKTFVGIVDVPVSIPPLLYDLKYPDTSRLALPCAISIFSSRRLSLLYPYHRP